MGRFPGCKPTPKFLGLNPHPHKQGRGNRPDSGSGNLKTTSTGNLPPEQKHRVLFQNNPPPFVLCFPAPLPGSPYQKVFAVWISDAFGDSVNPEDDPGFPPTTSTFENHENDPTPPTDPRSLITVSTRKSRL